jgi:hypothetical protein
LTKSDGASDFTSVDSGTPSTPAPAAVRFAPFVATRGDGRDELAFAERVARESREEEEASAPPMSLRGAELATVLAAARQEPLSSGVRLRH